MRNRRLRKRYERYLKYLESIGCEPITLEYFNEIQISPCYYCDNELSPTYLSTPDIDKHTFEYKISERAICSFCKNLKNSSKLSTQEAELIIKKLIETRKANAGKNCRQNTSRPRLRRAST